MARHQFYMVRLAGGPFDPRRKIASLAKAMEIAFKMSAKYGEPATILQTVSRVEVVDGKPVWTDETPKR